MGARNSYTKSGHPSSLPSLSPFDFIPGGTVQVKAGRELRARHWGRQRPSWSLQNDHGIASSAGAEHVVLLGQAAPAGRAFTRPLVRSTATSKIGEQILASICRYVAVGHHQSGCGEGLPGVSDACAQRCASSPSAEPACPAAAPAPWGVRRVRPR